MTDLIITGLLNTFDPINILVMVGGLAIGIVGGMLPGITVVTTIALFVPFTFSLPAETALIALGAIYCGASYGGANAAILINAPGQPGSIATTFDGYPMTNKGEAEKGLFTALLASAYGGIVGAVLLLLFFEPLAKLALHFGSEAFFWMAIFGLTTLAAMATGHVLRSLFAGLLGLALSTVGLDPSSGFPRFTFDIFSLTQGFDMVVLMTSLFSLSQMLFLMESKDEYIADFVKKPGVFLHVARYLATRCKVLLTTSSVLGTFIGGLPGAGGSVAAIITYNEAKRWDKEPERYGTGIIEGVAVPESANNACVGGSLVPLMALGIPGSASAAVLMGGLLAQGLTPGPQLLETNASIAYTFIASLIVVNLYMIAVGFGLAKVCASILDVPKRYIIPSVITLSMLGAFSLRNSLFDVLILLLFGGGAYLCLKAKIQPASIALGVVLGPIIEESLTTTRMRALSEDSIWSLLIFEPLSMLFIVLSIASLSIPLILKRVKMRRGAQSDPSESVHMVAPKKVFNKANAFRFEQIMIGFLTLVSAFFVYESLLLSGNEQTFPLIVFSLMTVMGVVIFVLGMFAPISGEKDSTPKAAYINIGVFFAVSLITYMFIPVMGFYTALFFCIICMLSISAFWNRGEPIRIQALARILGMAFAIVAVQYTCFSFLLQVPTPTGFFI